jgi:hypothetical protein
VLVLCKEIFADVSTCHNPPLKLRGCVERTQNNYRAARAAARTGMQPSSLLANWSMVE